MARSLLGCQEIQQFGSPAAGKRQELSQDLLLRGENRYKTEPFLEGTGSMSRKRKAVEAEILQVVADVFSEKGYRATTLDDLVAAAGFSRATFYTYFPSKEELLRCMYREVTSSTQAAIERITAEDLSIPEKLRRIVRY
jgi:hypothetical protein